MRTFQVNTENTCRTGEGQHCIP